eukprot:GHVU01164417.1.p1 GENE.GHVU01164417.1~~GHVU01164417.1.p1  ORF type:complete len:249 (+),score=18.92 GHVU01164417.1:147-893(+)
MVLTFRVSEVEGDERKMNWVYYRPPLCFCDGSSDGTEGHEHDACRSSHVVVFFPGDLSDFASASTYSMSLEAVTWVLSVRFPKSHLIVVRAHSVVDRFARYSNFCSVDELGLPVDRLWKRQVGSALRHLDKLIDASVRPQTCGGTRIEEVAPREITLVAFSKGCIPASCILLDLALTEDPLLLKEKGTIFSQITACHLVDCGLPVPPSFSLNGRHWKQIAQKAPQCRIFSHVTPRQGYDVDRPWLRRV